MAAERFLRRPRGPSWDHRSASIGGWAGGQWLDGRTGARRRALRQRATQLEIGMRLRKSLIYPLAAACLATMPAAAPAQQAAEEFQPQIGQVGKDVIWWPTPQALVDKMLDMAKVGPGDHV